ncbi:MAG: hypothetical protein JWO25_3721 [Alphaproteobacteria bacterium]|nr:hypothetical protein [Alphaproteobacteria bacterium]
MDAFAHSEIRAGVDLIHGVAELGQGEFRSGQPATGAVDPTRNAGNWLTAA